MKYILTNYKYTPEWLKDYTDDYLIYDQSEDKNWLKDFDQSKIIYCPHGGQVDYDKLRYLAENYDNLPEVFLWGKTNLFKYITKEEFDRVKDNKTFTPLLTQNHKIYSDNLGPVNYYSGNMYWERNNNWYFSQFQSRYIHSWSEWADIYSLANPPYIPFAPGGNYILTRDKVHKYSRDYYQNMASMLPYCFEPVEAQCAERSYTLMWSNLL